MRTRVKICGLTNVADALTACYSGADAIGLVFYPPSPRNVSLETAAEIAAAVPAFVTKTALFVDPDADFVRQVLQQVNIDLLQFHGNESAKFCESFGRPYMKAVAMQEGTDLHGLARDYTRAIGLLLDTYKPGVPGGTGESFNWQWARPPHPMPVILAGGLTAENVVSAIEEVQPWAVDVSGGVEECKGKKSPEKVQKFIKNVMSRVE
ncbi:phosphoribosylanthranilate isomerase [Thiomicrorhabdus sp. HH1]|uniref:N-(5'-phosphoribosyl)anthranilate isomerase n=2 Tax=Piscirickettsiaceae TaxID=135616 RepID=A0ABS0BWV4_9GAMM|nr:phosphoribosylanthranilate isomerase [Thiomicrorhabdus heinhorstiae]